MTDLFDPVTDTPTSAPAVSEVRGLPADPVADVLADYQDDFGDQDVSMFARGLGLDPDLVQGLLDHRIETLNVAQIGAVCEALYASPYDLWHPEVARTILDVYGPERWPTTILPLNEPAQPPGPDDEFLARRLEQRADELISRPTLTRTSLSGLRPVPGTGPVTATGYTITGTLAVDDTGRVVPADPNSAGDPTVEYHFQLTHHSTATVAGITAEDVAAGPPPGHDAHAGLTEAAGRLRAETAGHVDVVQFTGPDGATAWIGWDSHAGAWDTWDDPRDHFPGPAEMIVTDTPALPDRPNAVEWATPEPQIPF